MTGGRIDVSPGDYDWLRQEARRRGWSVAQVVHALIRTAQLAGQAMQTEQGQRAAREARKALEEQGL